MNEENINESLSERKTFLLSIECIQIIDELAERFSREANFTIGKAKIVELALHEIKNRTLKELLRD